MNSKQRRTLQSIFTKPTPASLPWDDIESLFTGLHATMSQGKGSRVRVELNGHDAVFHVPHPKREAEQGRIRAVRDFLEKAGVKP